MLTMFVNYMEKHEDEILDELKEYFFEEGKKEGKKEGMDETSLKIAGNFKGSISDEEISKRTGVPLDEVRKL